MCITRSPHRNSPRHCTATVYLTVPNVLSKALISHWNAVTKWQLARGILYAPRTCIGLILRTASVYSRQHVYLSSIFLSFSFPSYPLFVTFVLYTLCPRFDSFDSFAMERENATSRLQTTLKFDRPAASATAEIFFPSVIYARTLDVLRKRKHGFTISAYLLRVANSLAKVPANSLRDNDKTILSLFSQIKKFDSLYRQK